MDEARDLLGIPRELDPSDALVESVHEAAGNVATLRTRVQAVESGEREATAVQLAALRETYSEERDRLSRMAKLAHDAGIDERRVRLAEDQAQLIATVLAAALTDPEWSLPAEAQARGRAVLGRHLRRATAEEGGEILELPAGE